MVIAKNAFPIGFFAFLGRAKVRLPWVGGLARGQGKLSQGLAVDIRKDAGGAFGPLRSYGIYWIGCVERFRHGSETSFLLLN